MKHFFLLLSMLVFCIQASFANDTACDSLAVTMVRYEQNWSDDVGTLSLWNHTKQTIYNIRFRLCYFDMSGTLLDYKDYYKTDIDIAPSMTKQVDIPAFEARRNYSYYKSNNLYEDRRFKITFKLLGYNESYIDQKTEKGLNDSAKWEGRIYEVVEQMPSFPGGQGALMQYLANNIKYPVTAKEDGVQGRVVVSFVVESNGSITDVQVVRSVDPSLDHEVQRVVRSMPKWIPGKQKGQAVRVRYNIPVSFRY
jgi:TonB family protein